MSRTSIRRRTQAFAGVAGLVLVIGSSGCAGRMVWSKPGLTQEGFNRDNYACQQEGRYGANEYGALIDRNLYQGCMRARGYTLTEP